MHNSENFTIHKTVIISVFAFLASGCASTAIDVAPESVEMPDSWARGGDPSAVDTGWLAEFEDPLLNALVAESVAHNFALEQERQRLELARHSVAITRSARLPAFDLAFDGSRRGSDDTSGNRAITESFGADIGVRFDVDWWGRLSKVQQAAQLDYAAQAASLAAAERELASTTASQYFDVIEAAQLLDVAHQRLEIAIESRDIVASGYRQGLNDALDLYLARNQVERERANVAQQEQVQLEARAALQLSLARYPGGDLVIDGELPVPVDAIPTGLPSELLARRPDIQQAWLDLLATDANLAAAHKARFPRLSLIGSSGVTSEAFSDLLNDGASGWSLAFGLTQPLFDAGRLAAQEKQALVQVRIAEQVWLSRVYQAFAEVENAISRTVSLDARYDALLDAEKNSQAALQLALEQYQRGLVNYTTVLESQRQAFEAAATVVQLKNQRLQNRLGLYVALGGNFESVN